jgi:predicted polyphosphate/ATP-dependent NAD kinase
VKTIGLIVNPVAGMGGSVGLKGTDGEMYDRALDLGARPVSPERAREFLDHVARHDQIRWLVGPGSMGADCAASAGIEFQVVGEIGRRPGPNDTRNIAQQMAEAGAELIAFAGGDGTARDIADAIGVELPVVAIPAGVKIYSAVFAYSARSASGLVDAFVEGAGLGEAEVLDIDEDAFREGRVDSRLYGFLLVPEDRRLLQAGKDSSSTEDLSDEAGTELARAVIEEMNDGTLYLLGSGTTVRLIADELGVAKTLLGVDAVLNGELIGQDLNERGILALLDAHRRAIIIVTPLGGNGFIFGRGNRQFTPAVLRRVGVDHIVIVASRHKLMQLQDLHVDTGDEGLDRMLHGYRDVIVGRDHTKLMRVR